MTGANPQNLVLAVYPFNRGFAFAFFEGPESPFEWGVKELKGGHKNRRTLDGVKELIDRYRPEALIIEDVTHHRSRRTSRIRKLYRALGHLAQAQYVDLHRYPKSEIVEYFASVGASTKHEIAQAIAIQIPAFAHRMPRFRKAWMSEDPRQSLFDAAALALVYYRKTGRSDSATPPES